jgi:pyridoxamine 5'-phosphate oxidase family protein
MDVFTAAELAYLHAAKTLARLATVDAHGHPHVTPVGWSLTGDQDAVEVGGRDLAETKKFRDIAATGHAALVIDEVLPPWHPQGIEIRGTAQAITEPEPRIRIHPHRIISWGFEGASGALTVPAITPTETGHPADQPLRPAAYAVLRSTRYDPNALAEAGAELEEFQRIHAAQPGYAGNIVIDAGDGTRFTLTLWESEQHVAQARAALGPVVQQLLNPLMVEPAQLLAVGNVLASDLAPTPLTRG